MPNLEVAIVGAGPYGLSIAAHLRQRGIDFRIFGAPMQNWRTAMPTRMFLKSDGLGSSLSDPEEALTLAQYCTSRGLPYGDHGVPIALQTFVDYALNFQWRIVPNVEAGTVMELTGEPGRFKLQLDTGERVTARRVVLAVGTTYFAHVPPPLVNLPRELVTHSRDHVDFAGFAGREVVVIGGGQSALETAALLHEQGARVQVLVRARELAWNPPPSTAPGCRNPYELQSALGGGWKAWFYCHMQSVFQHFPRPYRAAIVRRAMGPAGAWWLKGRVVGRIPVLCGQVVQRAGKKGERVGLSVAGDDGRTWDVSADHVICGTGYRVDLNSLPFLRSELSLQLRREGAAPALSSDFESSVPGLYFTGLASAHRFGPSMRFVFGAEYTARKIAQAVAKNTPTGVHRTKARNGAGVWRQRTLSGQASLPRQIGGTAGRLTPCGAVLVLNLGEYPFHQGSLGIIRSLGSMGIPVYAVQRNRLIPSGASRYLRGKFVWNGDARNGGDFLEAMARAARMLAGPTVLVPADDLSSILIAENDDALAGAFSFARPPADLPRTVANKQRLHELCDSLGVSRPGAEFASSHEELLHRARHTRLPVVVKVVEPWMAPRGCKSTAILSERQDLISYCENFVRQDPNTTLMLQEMIPTPVSEDWFVHGYFDRHANPVVMFTGIKLRSYPAFAGPTTLARAVRNDALEHQAVGFLRAVGYQGIMDLDYRLDKRDGSYKLLDFNPRIGAQFRLFKTADGTDVARALYGDLTGQTPRAGPQIEGRTFLAEIPDLLASRAYWRKGALSFRDWRQSVQKIDERAWYHADDPLPFLQMCLHLPFRAAWRALSTTIGQWGKKAIPPLPAHGRSAVGPGANELSAHLERREE